MPLGLEPSTGQQGGPVCVLQWGQGTEASPLTPLLGVFLLFDQSRRRRTSETPWQSEDLGKERHTDFPGPRAGKWPSHCAVAWQGARASGLGERL